MCHRTPFIRFYVTYLFWKFWILLLYWEYVKKYLTFTHLIFTLSQKRMRYFFHPFLKFMCFLQYLKIPSHCDSVHSRCCKSVRYRFMIYFNLIVHFTVHFFRCECEMRWGLYRIVAAFWFVYIYLYYIVNHIGSIAECEWKRELNLSKQSGKVNKFSF